MAGANDAHDGVEGYRGHVGRGARGGDNDPWRPDLPEGDERDLYGLGLEPLYLDSRIRIRFYGNRLARRRARRGDPLKGR